MRMLVRWSPSKKLAASAESGDELALLVLRKYRSVTFLALGRRTRETECKTTASRRTTMYMHDSGGPSIQL